MKIKFLLPVLLSVLIGIVFGKLIFSQYDKTLTQVYAESEPIYALQYGAYSTEENMIISTRSLDNYAFIKEDNYYKVFIALTSNINNIEKLKDIYGDKDNNIYVKELRGYTSNFYKTLKEYDLILEKIESKDTIKAVQNTVLEVYKEMVISDEY